jgi:hypothetical protein
MVSQKCLIPNVLYLSNLARLLSLFLCVQSGATAVGVVVGVLPVKVKDSFAC